jgi:hypothetical protein
MKTAHNTGLAKMTVQSRFGVYMRYEVACIYELPARLRKQNYNQNI